MDILEKINQSVPYPLHQLAKRAYCLIPLHIREKKDFFEKVAWLEESQWWSPERLAEYQNQELRKLIHHAYVHVPYYKQLFKKHSINPSDIETVQDLPKIPILNKEDVRKNLSRITATNFDKRNMIKRSTSGTTGRPLEFFVDKKMSYYTGNPFLWRHFRREGHGFNDIVANLSEWTLKPTWRGERRLSSYHPVRKLLILSGYDLRKDNIGEYAGALKRYRPKFFYGFPSSLHMLASFLRENFGERVVDPRAVFTAGEVLYPWQRETIEEYFGCKLYDWYGMNEGVILAGECEKQSGYHLNSEYGITEFVDKDGIPVTDEKPGEIIATGLAESKYVMPFIRYRTGDTGIPLKRKCDCGRGLPLMELMGGRERNFAETKSGGLIPVTIVDIPHATESVEQFQFVQEKKGHLRLRIIKKEGFGGNDLTLIHKNLEEKFGREMEVEIEFVDEIPRTRGGKTPLLIQDIKTIHTMGNRDA